MADIRVISTPCPFAPRANVRWIETAKAEESVAREVRNFSRTSEVHASTLLAVELGSPGRGARGVDGVGARVHSVLHASQETEGDVEALYSGIEDAKWRLLINGAPMFALVLSDLYGVASPRYLSSGTWLLLQPERIFDELLTPRERLDRSRLSRRVARAFNKSGRDFYFAHSKQVPRSLRILVDDVGTGVAWWKCPIRQAFSA